jgi:hypothetical protein
MHLPVTVIKFFSAAGDGMVVLWDLEKPDEGELIARLNNSIYVLHLLPNNLLVLGHNYDGIHLLDWQQKKEVASLRLTMAAIFDIKSVGNELWIAEGDGGVTVVDLSSLTIKTKIHASEKSARVIAVNPAAAEVAVGYSDNFIRIFDAHHYTSKNEWEAHTNSFAERIARCPLEVMEARRLEFGDRSSGALVCHKRHCPAPQPVVLCHCQHG